MRSIWSILPNEQDSLFRLVVWYYIGGMNNARTHTNVIEFFCWCHGIPVHLYILSETVHAFQAGLAPSNSSGQESRRAIKSKREKSENKLLQ